MFNVAYDTPHGSRLYCLAWTPLNVAETMLERLKARYLDANGEGRIFPNKKGRYEMWNARIVGPEFQEDNAAKERREADLARVESFFA